MKKKNLYAEFAKICYAEVAKMGLLWSYKKRGGGAGFALIPELQELTATVLR